MNADPDLHSLCIYCIQYNLLVQSVKIVPAISYIITVQRGNTTIGTSGRTVSHTEESIDFIIYSCTTEYR